MSESQNNIPYQLTIQPGFSEFDEPIQTYIKRVNYGPSMTVYTIGDKNSALLAKAQVERQGYIVHIQEPNGDTRITPHNVFHDGIVIANK